MTATDWTAEKLQALEARMLIEAATLRRLGGDQGHASVLERAALALQTQRNLLAAANARIAELEALIAAIPRDPPPFTTYVSD